MNEDLRRLYIILLTPNIYDRELWSCRKAGNTITISLYNDYDDVFEEYILSP